MFKSENYKIMQKALSIGNKYIVYEDGEEILRCAQKKLALKEDFKFKDSEENLVLKVTTDQILDIAASYAVKDMRSDEAVGAVKEDFSLLRHKWRIFDNSGKQTAVIKEDKLLFALIRRTITTLLPFSYTIKDEKGYLGKIKGHFSLRDTYSLNLNPDQENKIDPRLAIAATVLIDAMEAN